MKTTTLVLATVVILIGSTRASAHRLDEYLQASRLSVEPDRIVLELDLTAGVSVADGIAASIDTDGNDHISAAESVTYSRAVVADLSLEVNKAPVALTVTSVEAPTIADMKHGVGIMRVVASGDLRGVDGRGLRIRYRNDHRADVGVFLVNAMAPGSTTLTLASQDRDRHQREIRLDYNVSPVWPTQVGWLFFAFLLLSSFFWLRQSSTRSNRVAGIAPALLGR